MLWSSLLAATAGARGLEFVGGKAATIDGSTQTPSFSLTGLTGGLASAPAAGDIVIACVAFESGIDRNVQCTTSGYTEVADLYSSGTEDDCQLGIYYKVLSDADATIAFNLGTSTRSVFVAHVWRGVNVSTPLDATTTTNTSVSNTRPNPPSITTVSSNAVIIAIGALVDADASTGTPNDSEMENFFQARLSFGNGNIAIVSRYLETPGMYDPPEFTGGSNGSDNGTCAATLALRPA